jgi:hypothetical protein
VAAHCQTAPLDELNGLFARDSEMALQWQAMQARHSSDLAALQDLFEVRNAATPLRPKVAAAVRRVLKRRMSSHSKQEGGDK